MHEAEVVVIGAASMDLKGRPRKAPQMFTSNPGTVRVTPGGAARNMAENLARLGVKATLLSAVGEDVFGRQVMEATAAAGVDTSQVLRSALFPTASYLALLDEKGLLAVSVDDMRILRLLTPEYIAGHTCLIAGARMVVMDGNSPPRTVKAILDLAAEHSIPVCVDPTSTMLAYRFRRHLARIYLATPNASEAEVLSQMHISSIGEAIASAHRLVALGVDIAIITLAGEGLCYATSEESGHVPAIGCEVVDYTGAGAALNSAVVFGLLNNLSVDEAVRLGVSAATLTLKSQETVYTSLSLELLYDQLVI